RYSSYLCLLSLHDALPIFYHALSRTVIELDGLIHLNPEVRENDRWREGFLKDHGYTVIRFSNEEVFNDIGDVLSRILSAVTSVKSEEHTSELQSRENLVCR